MTSAKQVSRGHQGRRNGPSKVKLINNAEFLALLTTRRDALDVSDDDEDYASELTSF